MTGDLTLELDELIGMGEGPIQLLRNDRGTATWGLWILFRENPASGVSAMPVLGVDMVDGVSAGAWGWGAFEVEDLATRPFQGPIEEPFQWLIDA